MAKVPQQESKVKPHPSSQSGILRLKMSRAFTLIMVLMPAALIFGIGWIGFQLGSRAATSSAAAVTPGLQTTNRLKAAALRPGPWGSLEQQPITLQIPDENLTDLAKLRTATPQWVFKGYSRNQILKLFSGAGVTGEELRLLSDTNHWRVGSDQIVIAPPDSVVRALSPAARSIIYTVLAQFPENVFQHSPFFWPTKEEAAFFAHACLTEPIRDLIRQLSYQKGNLWVFADLESLVANVKMSDSQLIQVLKLLSTKPAVLAKLRVTPETDVDAMIRYWGVGGVTRVMEPALEAVSRIPQGRTVTFLAVLPPFARERLNTYPEISDNDGMDGNWTAFNFFNSRPGPINPEAGAWGRKLNADYFNVFTDPRYGDIVILSRPTGEVVQAAIYLADDLVFTRLGPSRWEPWLIIRLADLQEISGLRLAHQEIATVSYYRNRVF